MRWIALLALLAACKSKAPDAAPPEARPSISDPIGFCARARLMLNGRRKCFPEDTSIKMALEEIAGIESSAPMDAGERRKSAAKCAVMLDGMLKVEQPANCPPDSTDAEVAELATFLAAWDKEKKAAPK